MIEFLQTPGVAIGAAAILGLIVGSFLNVVILRLPARLMHSWREQSREILEIESSTDDAALPPPGIVREPSHCPRCKHPLGILENIPVLSWLVQRGRCKHCGASISAQYPLVELLASVASAIVVWKFGFTEQALAGLFFTWALIALAGIDAHTQLLPDQIVLPLLWSGLLLSLSFSLRLPWLDVPAQLHPLFIDPGSAILGAAIGYLSLWSIYWLFKLATGKDGMGYGDFKLLGALGAWMGPWALLPIVLLSSLIGAIVGSVFLALQGRDRATTIPFGPFLAAAGWVQFTIGDRIEAIYRAIFGLA